MKQEKDTIDDEIIEKGIPFNKVKMMTGNEVKKLMHGMKPKT